MSRRISALAGAKPTNVSSTFALRSPVTFTCSPASHNATSRRLVANAAHVSTRRYHIARQPCLGAPCRISVLSSPPLLASRGCAAFSTSAPALATRQPSMPSRSTLMEQQETQMQMRGEKLDYLGVLEGTIIRPPKKDLPAWNITVRDFFYRDMFNREVRRKKSLFKKPRIQYEWTYYKSRVFQIFKHFYYGWKAKYLRPVTWNINGVPEWRDWRGWRHMFDSKSHHNEITEIAENLYFDMYRTLCEGNVSAMGSRLAPGLQAQLTNRIAGRSPNVFLEWDWIERLEPAKLYSYRVELLPGPKDQPLEQADGFVQAVVGISSTQYLMRKRRDRVLDPKTGDPVWQYSYINKEGHKIHGTPAYHVEKSRNTKAMRELVVIQRPIRRGVIYPWQIWGTTKETTADDVIAMNRRQKKMIRYAKHLQNASRSG